MSAPAPLRGRGFVSRGTVSLTVSFPGAPWWLQVTQRDGEGYERLLPYHERDVAPLDLRELLGGDPAGEVWRPLRVPPGMPAAVETEVLDWRLSLLGVRGAVPPLDPAGLVGAFEAWLQRGPRRLA
ncbi:MAG: hypothetical protein AB7N76_15675 [Planctomycetota bacterium]